MKVTRVRGIGGVFSAPVVLAFVCSLLCSARASALPEGRHYEMVSPVYKQGYGVMHTVAVEPEGDSVAFTSQGAFSDPLSGGVFAAHFYLARRGGLGWSTGSIEPGFGAVADYSADLRYVLAAGPLGPNSGVENYSATEEVLQLHSTGVPNTLASWEPLGEVVMEQLNHEPIVTTYEGGSAENFCQLVVSGQAPLTPAAKNAEKYQLYDLDSGCDGSQPGLSLLSATNTGAPINRVCEAEVGSALQGGAGAVDEDGGEVFFSTPVRETDCAAAYQLFVRLGDMRTVEVSRPLEAGSSGGCVGESDPVAGEVPCAGAAARPSANFKGASEDGSKVFFTTSAALTGEDRDTGSDLYMATIGCPGVEPLAVQSCETSEREVTSLVQVSHDPVAGQAAEVQGAVRIAADGSRAYFVARGVLSEGANAQGHAPVLGADNLYVYDSESRTTAFVAELCSRPAQSGAVVDLRCPRDPTGSNANEDRSLWEGVPQAQATHDGAFLVFGTYAQLLPEDTDSAEDIYRYDAETGALERVSVGEGGYDANGNNDASDATIQSGFIDDSKGAGANSIFLEHELGGRAISEDGSRIVFSTAEPLSPRATNGKVDIYEWHNGVLALISTGTNGEDDTEPVITPSGRDIFFTTSQGLMAQDADGVPDIYDARLGEGFAPVAAEPEQCSGEACAGPLTNPAPLLVPGSVSQVPGGNYAATSEAAPLVKAKQPKKAKPKKKKKRGRASRARRRGVSLSTGRSRR
jgi:hypothetical protein